MLFVQIYFGMGILNLNIICKSKKKFRINVKQQSLIYIVSRQRDGSII